MIKVYEYISLIPEITCDCDLIYTNYDEVKQAYNKTVISELSPHQLIDLVEGAICCADSKSKEVTIKRLKQRIAGALAEFESYSAQIDFSENEAGRKSAYLFMAEVYNNIQIFDSLLDTLCGDYSISIAERGGYLKLTAWESALCWHYQYGGFITSREEMEQAIKQYYEYLDVPNIKIDSYRHSCRRLKKSTDITGLSNLTKDMKTSSFEKVIKFLKLQNLPTEQAEADRDKYLENKEAYKSNL